jgi:hypothetical protein
MTATFFVLLSCRIASGEWRLADSLNLQISPNLDRAVDRISWHPLAAAEVAVIALVKRRTPDPETSLRVSPAHICLETEHM